MIQTSPEEEQRKLEEQKSKIELDLLVFFYCKLLLVLTSRSVRAVVPKIAEVHQCMRGLLHRKSTGSVCCFLSMYGCDDEHLLQ